jgi:hypothetical protein
MADGAMNATLSEFEESVIQRLERLVTAIEKSYNLQREDFEFRKEQLLKAADEQRALVDRLTGPTSPAAPQLEHGRHARRR